MGEGKLMGDRSLLLGRGYIWPKGEDRGGGRKGHWDRRRVE